MNKQAATDIVIFGGGIAGLWLLNRLRQQGYSVILLETHSLGGGQTHKSQGIIHGGLKYALSGVMTKEAQALGEMPKRWQACFTGQGDFDLRSVPLLSQINYLWSPQSFTAKFTGFLASLALSSQVKTLPVTHYPAIFQHPQFKGQVYALNEWVIDVTELIKMLVKDNQDVIFKIDELKDHAFQFNDKGQLQSVVIHHQQNTLQVTAQHFVLAAGAGNAQLLKQLNLNHIKMQRRPLHMTLAKLPFNLPLYAHCLGLHSRPRLTMTTHYCKDGGMIWYLGGMLAEEGVKLNQNEQICAAKIELQQLFPWLNFTKANFATFLIDRAEPLQKTGFKPQSCFTQTTENMTVIWPTKLALAPHLSDEVLQSISKINLKAGFSELRELRAWPIPPLAKPIWEELFCKNVA